MAESKKIYVLWPQFFPGNGGKEVSIDKISMQARKQNIGDVKIICFDDMKTDYAKFDASYDIPVTRIKSRVVAKIHDFCFKNVKSDEAPKFLGGKRKFNITDKAIMLIQGFYPSVLILIKLIKEINRNKNNHILIHCHSLSMCVVAGLCKRFCRHVHIRSVFINGFVYKKSGFKFADSLIARTLNDTDFTLCVSQRSAQCLKEQFGLHEDKVKPYKLWVNCEDLNPFFTNSNEQRHKGKINILFVGRVVPDKGIWQIFDLVEYINKMNLQKKYNITLIGPANDILKETISSFEGKHHNIKYLGKVAKPALWDYYKSHDIFLMPSLWEEGAGNVILESYAFGMPVISSDKGGIPEYVSSFKHYRIIKGLSPIEILSAIDSLYCEIINIPKKDFMKECQEILKENFSIKNFEVHKGVYEKLLS